MADNKEGEESNSNGNEWEVVSLTASTYAAAPGSKCVEVRDHDMENTYEEDGMDTSEAMFMSRYFVCLPIKRESLPLHPDEIEIQKEHIGEAVISDVIVDTEGGRSNRKDEDAWDIKGLTLPDELPGLDFLDNKGKLSLHGTNFESSTTLQGLNLLEKEQNIYNASFNSFHSEVNVGESTKYENNQGLDFPEDTSQFPKPKKEEIFDGSNLPCEAWWKRRAASLYDHAKDANEFWSICIAAAVMGLVILGHRWQQERWRVLQLKWQFTVGDEKIGKMMGPVSWLKYVIVGGHQPSSFSSASASGEH